MAYLNAAPQSVRTDTTTAGPTPPANDTKKKPTRSISMAYQLGFATGA